MSKHNSELSEAISKTIWAYNHGQYRYMNEFIRLNKSASDMLQLGLFPDAKEITESYGAYNAVMTKLKQYDPNDQEVTLVSVGDGTTPRTASLFAFRTKWNCISVDPLIKQDKIQYWEENIQRLTCLPNTVEDINLLYDKVVIVAVHSHANLQNILCHVGGTVRSIVAIPCCVPYKHESIKPIEYQDSGIWSPMNKVMVWRTV
jgi:hypothetical protein